MIGDSLLGRTLCVLVTNDVICVGTSVVVVMVVQMYSFLNLSLYLLVMVEGTTVFLVTVLVTTVMEGRRPAPGSIVLVRYS